MLIERELRTPAPVSRLIPAGDGLRHNNLNAMRLAMALLVVWSHCFALWFSSEADEPLSLLTNGFYNAGNIGVLSFFTISGFLISLSYQRSSSWRSYLAKRIARIHPGYVVAITLCSLVVVPAYSSRMFGYLTGEEARGLASNLLLRNYIVDSDAFDAGAVNGSLWSIPMEFFCYLGVLAAGVAGLLRVRSFALVLAVAMMAVKCWLDISGRHPGAWSWTWLIGYPYEWFVVFPPFILGAAILSYRDRLPRIGVLAIGLLAATLVSAHLPLPGNWAQAITHLLFPPTLAYGIFYLAFHPRWQLGDAARYGDFSYGCYLYAFPIQQMLRVELQDDSVAAFAIYVVLSLLGSLIAGVASWFLVERWFEAKASRRRKPLDEEATLVAP